MPPRFLKGRLHLPTHDKPPEDLLRVGTEIGAEQSLGGESTLRIAHQHPAYGNVWQESRAVPERSSRSHLHAALPAPVPVVHSDGCPDSTRILSDDRKVWETFALQARPAQLTGSTRWGRIVERCVQAQAGNERHRLGQETPAACKESEASLSGIGHRNDLSLGPPTPHHKERLTRPVGYLLVLLAALGSIALGGGEDAQERQCPYTSGPGHGHQEHQAHPPQAAALYEALVGGAHGVAVDPFGRDLLAPTPLQCFVNSDHQRAAGHERSHEQAEQHTTRLPARPAGTVEDPMVALELFGLPQTHDTQRCTNGPFA